MAKRGPITSFLLHDYRTALRAGRPRGQKLIAVHNNAEYKTAKNVFYSFGIPALAKQLDEHIAQGLVSREAGLVIARKAIEFAGMAQLGAVKKNPELIDKIAENPKIPFEKHIKPTEGLIGTSIMIKDPLKPATVQLIMTYNGITIKVTERKK